MAVSSAGIIETSKFVDIEVDSSVEIIVSGGVTLLGYEVDNSDNTSDVFFKVWDATGVTLGTDAPIIVTRVDAGSKAKILLNSNAGGLALGTGLAIACVTTGGTPGSTSPTNKVRATLFTD